MAMVIVVDVEMDVAKAAEVPKGKRESEITAHRVSRRRCERRIGRPCTLGYSAIQISYPLERFAVVCLLWKGCMNNERDN